DWSVTGVQTCALPISHVVKMPLRNTRLVVNAMEPRGFVASYDKASGRFTVYTGGQSTFGQKMATAEVLKVTPDKVHAQLGNVGEVGRASSRERRKSAG